MMRPIILKVQLFKKPLSTRSARRSRKALLFLLESITIMNEMFLRDNPSTPLLYESGVEYIPEINTEEWEDIPSVIKDGGADCEDLAMWRCAELRTVFGEEAKPHIRWRIDKNGAYRFHALVQRADGTIEDPSKILGMRKYGIVLGTDASQEEVADFLNQQSRRALAEGKRAAASTLRKRAIEALEK